MKIIADDIVGAGNPLEDSRKRLLEAKRKIYEKIRVQLAKEPPVKGVCPRNQRNQYYDYGNFARKYQ